MHSYVCMYMHGLHTICKHIHLVSRQQKQSDVISTTNKSPCTTKLLPVISHMSHKQSQIRIIKDRLCQTVAKVLILTEKCTSGHELLMAESHLNSAAHILELTQMSTCTFPNKSTSPANTCITTQRFHSTRKRQKQATTRLTKPSTQEKRQ